jgi:ATP-dependent phosphoenolpyruvate carboxykinase
LESSHRRASAGFACTQVFANDEDIKHCKADIIHNASPSVLIEAALRREQGTFLTSTGALSVRSGAKTGRSPKDKRVVVEPQSEDNVWWGPVCACSFWRTRARPVAARSVAHPKRARLFRKSS